MSRLLNLLRWRRDRLESDLDRELRYHLERRVDDLIGEGLGETEARRRVRLEFGGMAQIQESVRDTWTWRWLQDLLRDIRYSVRSLARSWGFSLGTMGVLALAVGGAVAIFSVVHAVLLQPLPYPNAERIVSIETLWTNTGRTSPDVSGPDFVDWQQRNDVFAAMAVSYGGNDFAAIVGNRAVFVNPRYVSADFFAVFGQTAAAGRLLSSSDIPLERAEPTVAVAAHHWALAHFGDAGSAIGKIISVYGSPLKIVGVAAPGFRYPGAADLWAPWRTTNGGTDRSLHNYQAVGKLEPGVSLTLAQATMRAIGDQLSQQHPENRLKTVTLVPLHDRLTGNLQLTLWALLIAVGIVWLIACANIASLQVARAVGRTREIALRAALGAGRGRVVRQLLAESLVLASAAGIAGILLAYVLVQGIVAAAPADLPRLDEVGIDLTVTFFALALSVVSVIFFGLVPALHASRLDLSDALKHGGAKSTGSAASSRLRSALVVSEVALSVILLVGAGLLLRSFQALQTVDLGFTTEKVLVAYTDYAVGDEREIHLRSAAYAEVLDRLRAVPGVRAAAGIAFLPMGREPRPARDYFVRGRPDVNLGERRQAEVYAITPDYFETLEIPLLAGRDFERTDTPNQPLVAIVNETLARSTFPGESALGQHIRTHERAPWMEIVGVVADTRWQDPSRQPPPILYAASLQGVGKSLSILARTSLDEESLASTLRALLNEANPTVPVRFETMEELFDFALAYPRFRTWVIGLFASMSAILAAVGIFSVLAYLVGQRRRELAVRQALGARTGDVFRLIVGHGLRLVAVGALLGMGGALAIARLLAGLLYDISPWDIGTYLGTVVLLGLTALAAVLVPAIKGAMITPVAALKQE